MNQDTIARYLRVSAVLMSPICPHLAEYTWRTILGESTSVFKSVWPAVGAVDEVILATRWAVNQYPVYSCSDHKDLHLICSICSAFLDDTVHQFRAQLSKMPKVNTISM